MGWTSLYGLAAKISRLTEVILAILLLALHSAVKWPVQIAQMEETSESEECHSDNDNDDAVLDACPCGKCSQNKPFVSDVIFV